MLFGRFVPLVAALAVAGAVAPKRVAPLGPGTFRTDTVTFVVLLIATIVIVAALTFFPAFLLGPIVQGLTDPTLLMRRDLINSALAILVFTVLLGLAYPLATTGVAQVLWPNKADGSQIERDGKVVGSRLIGQDFKRQRPALLPVAALRHRTTTRPAPSSTTSGRTRRTSRRCSRRTSPRT